MAGERIGAGLRTDAAIERSNCPAEVGGNAQVELTAHWAETCVRAMGARSDKNGDEVGSSRPELRPPMLTCSGASCSTLTWMWTGQPA
jgi:hypothetical protein